MSHDKVYSMEETGARALFTALMSLLASLGLSGFLQIVAVVMGIVASFYAIRYYNAARRLAEASLRNIESSTPK